MTTEPTNLKVRSGKKLLSRFEAMAVRHKAYEARETMRKLMPGLPVVVRLDGRSFHTFTRGMARPFEARVSQAMIESTKYLVEKLHANIGYTQSDEISIAFLNSNVDSALIFDGRIQKICSVFAAMATAKFNQCIAATMPEKAHLLPVFDARVYQYPTLELATEAFLFRALDCAKNSITMAASAYYSHKELHGKGGAAKHEMLRAKGVHWPDYPAFFKDGTWVRRESVTRQLTAAEMARIPAAHRQTGPVTRSVITEVPMPPFSRVTNQERVVFFGEAPQVLTAQTPTLDTEDYFD